MRVSKVVKEHVATSSVACVKTCLRMNYPTYHCPIHLHPCPCPTLTHYMLYVYILRIDVLHATCPAPNCWPAVNMCGQLLHQW